MHQDAETNENCKCVKGKVMALAITRRDVVKYLEKRAGSLKNAALELNVEAKWLGAWARYKTRTMGEKCKLDVLSKFPEEQRMAVREVLNNEENKHGNET